MKYCFQLRSDVNRAADLTISLKLNLLDGKKLYKKGIATESTYLNVSEAAVLTGVSKQKLYLLVARRKLPHFRKGRRIYFDRNRLQKWVKVNIE